MTLNSTSRCTESSASTAFVVGSTTISSAKKIRKKFSFCYYHYNTSFYRYSTLYEELVCFRARSGHSAIHVQESFQELMDRRGHDYADTYVAPTVLPSLAELPRSVVRPRGGEC